MQRHTYKLLHKVFKVSLFCCFENALTQTYCYFVLLIKTINVSIDCVCNQIPNILGKCIQYFNKYLISSSREKCILMIRRQQSVALVLLKIMNRNNESLFSLKYVMRTFNFVPRCTWFVHGMGLNFFSTIKQFSCCGCL